MSTSLRAIDLNPEDFEMADYDNVTVVLPKKPIVSPEDIDAQLFEYVLSGGKQINSIADLDDAWVKDNFEGMDTIEDVKDAIKRQYDKDLELSYNDLKLHACEDAVVSRLRGTVPQDLVDNNVQAAIEGQKQQLDMMHVSFEQFLREEHLSKDQFEKKVREEVVFRMKLNVALDLMAKVLNTQVGNHEITEYLSTPNPEKFLEEIREKGMVEEARRAAVRVKVMRRVVETAIVEEEGGSEEPKNVVPEEDIEIPDFENMPEPHIRNDKSKVFTFEKVDSAN